MTPTDTSGPDDSSSTPSSSPVSASHGVSRVVARGTSSLASLRALAHVRWNAPRLRQARRILARLLNRYPPLSPAPEGIWPRIALGIVGAMALAFTIFFSAYLFARHDAYTTHAEDLGIMDQALWNTLHGAPLHQTICDRVTDNNCLGDVSRLAIHFEPITFPLSLLYLVALSPKTLQFVQALIVASGAFPAFWLAMRRLRSPFAGIVFAAAYLLFPSHQAAVTDDFHAVTLSAAFSLFALYFMPSRNNIGLIIACLLVLSTKEEIPPDPWGLSQSFYRFTVTSANGIPHATSIHFSPSLQLVGYGDSPAPALYVNNPYLNVTTYWRVEEPLTADDAIEMVFIRADGSQFTEDEFAMPL